MKNKNIIESFKAIKPTKDEKYIMLENILSRKKKATSFHKLLIPALSFALIITININANVTENITPAVAAFRLTPERIKFIYNNKCYEEKDIIIGKNLTQIGRITKIENQYLENFKIYKDEFNTVVLDIENYYLTFVETKCFKNMKGQII